MKKKILLKSSIFLLVISVIIISTVITLAAANISLNVTTLDNKATISWENSDNVHLYSYKVKKSINDEAYSTIYDRTAEDVKVLNIYPGTGNQISFSTYNGESINVPKSASLKKWMEESNGEDSHGYGRGLIDVDLIDIDTFNANPSTYLKKDENGDYNYDVIFFGTWDENGKKDLNTTSKSVVEEYINSGNGVIFGHDTLSSVTTDALYHPNFASLSHYVNLSTATSWTTNIDTKVYIAKKWYIYNISMEYRNKWYKTYNSRNT